MRNTSKAQSLLRAQDEREQRDASASGDGEPIRAEGSALPESGERGRGAAVRSARAELSTHARAVENMNEAVYSPD